jgi:amidase
MNGFQEYDQYDVLGLAELVRSGDVTPVDLVEAAISRIEARNPRLNAVIHTMFDQARRRAQGALPDGPFRGVPFLLKDLLCGYAGEPMRNGSRFHSSYIAGSNSPLTDLYLAAGLIVLGKTNTPEYGITAVTEPELFGPSNNPWNTAHTTGGSSGGSAAAVAARMVPAAHAGDGLGSIRIPAACCGLFGLKPTRGRTPGSVPYLAWQHFVCEHVLTRSVRDSAALLDATAVYPRGALNLPPTPAGPFLAEVGRAPGKLRIAFTSTPFLGDTVDPEAENALADAVTLCRELGHELVEAAPVIDGPANARAILTMLSGEIRADMEEAGKELGKKPAPDGFERTTWALGLMGGRFSAAEFIMAIRLLQRTASQIGDFFRDYDLLLTPTLAQPPAVTGSMLPSGAEAAALSLIGRLRAGSLLQAVGMLDTAAKDSFRFTPYTPLINATGQPAMSVPLYWTANGLPMGAHFVGRYGDEATLIRLAAQLEQARPWADRMPPLA